MNRRVSIHITLVKPWWASRVDVESHAARVQALKRFRDDEAVACSKSKTERLDAVALELPLSDDSVMDAAEQP